MTLISIITDALATIGRSTDQQSMEAWRQKFTIFANDGARDLAEYLELRRTDTVTAEDGQIEISDLPMECVKIVSVKQNGSDLTFTTAPDSDHVYVGTNGEVDVEYRYLPKKMENDIDTPGIPDALHHLLVPYVVFREHMTAEPRMQRRGDLFWQNYNDGRIKARKTYGEYNTYKLANTGWF